MIDVTDVEARRWDGSYASQSQIVTWGHPHISGWFDGVYYLDVQTDDGGHERAEAGDSIARDSDGHFYVLKASNG